MNQKYLHFGISGFSFPGKKLQNEENEELLNLKVSRRKPIKEKASKVYTKKIRKSIVPNYDENKSPYSVVNNWKIYNKYQAKTYPRKGFVKFSYTSRKRFESHFCTSKTGKTYERNNRCTNAAYLKSLLENEGDLNSYMKDLNSHRISYISREDATRVNEFGHTLDENKILYTYNQEGQKFYLRNDEAITLVESDSTFNLVLSPEDVNVNLSEATRLFMKKFLPHVKNGKPSYWFAANHYNTEHPHVHLIISKTDRDTDSELFVPKDYSAKRMSLDYSDCLSQLMGERTWMQELSIRNSKATYFGFSQTDNIILERAEILQDGSYRLSLERMSELSKPIKDTVRRRLWNLKTKNMAMYQQTEKAWLIKKDFDLELKKDSFMKMFGFDFNSEEERAKFFVHKRTKSEKGFVGTIVDFKREDLYEDKVVLLIKDSEGLYHFFEDYVNPMLYKVQLNTQVELLRTDRGMSITRK